MLDLGADGECVQRLLTDVPYTIIEAVSRAVVEAERALGRSRRGRGQQPFTPL